MDGRPSPAVVPPQTKNVDYLEVLKIGCNSPQKLVKFL